MTTETDQKVDNILNKFDSGFSIDANKNGDNTVEKEKEGYTFEKKQIKIRRITKCCFQITRHRVS
jgi:hypothetical protein